jgi:hypothetical protein
MEVSMSGTPRFLVSRDPDDGRVWVACDSFTLMRTGDGPWAVGSPSADDAKDNFDCITEPAAAMAFFTSASAAAESNPRLKFPASQAKL